MAIQETKIDSTITASELFPETCMYSMYRKDRNTHDGMVMLLIHRDVSRMPIMELENNSESVWVKIFANKSSHYVASWYPQPNGIVEDFQLFRDQLDHIKSHYKGKKLPSVHILGDFNFREIVWPARLSKSGSMLSQSEGQMLLDIMDDQGCLVLLFVAFWFILLDDLFFVLPCVILYLCFSVLLALRLPRLGKRELILVLFMFV